MSYVMIIAVVVILTVVPFNGIIPLDEREQYLIDNYKGFVDVCIESTTDMQEDLLDTSGLGLSDTGSLGGSDIRDVPNMQVLGNLDKAGQTQNDDLEIDIRDYL